MAASSGSADSRSDRLSAAFVMSASVALPVSSSAVSAVLLLMSAVTSASDGGGADGGGKSGGGEAGGSGGGPGCGATGGDGGTVRRQPQSSQSEPTGVQSENSAPGPPSSQAPSTAKKQALLQTMPGGKGEGGGGEGSGGEGGGGGGGGGEGGAS